MPRKKKEKGEKKKRKISAYNQFVKDFSKVHGKSLGKNRMKLVSKFWNKTTKSRRTGWDKPMTKEHLARVDKDVKFDAGNFELIKMGADAKAKAEKKSKPKPQKKNVVKIVEKKVQKKMENKVQKTSPLKNKKDEINGILHLKTLIPGFGVNYLKSLLKT